MVTATKKVDVIEGPTGSVRAAHLARDPAESLR